MVVDEEEEEEVRANGLRWVLGFYWDSRAGKLLGDGDDEDDDEQADARVAGRGTVSPWGLGGLGGGNQARTTDGIDGPNASRAQVPGCSNACKTPGGAPVGPWM